MLTYPDIDPVIFSIGSIPLHWYGMMYVLGFVAAWILASRRAKQSWSPIKPNQVDDLIFYGMLGVILGGRIGYSVFYGWQTWGDDPLQILKIWRGGMSFHGGLIGVVIAMWLFGRRLGLGMWQVTDFVAPIVPIALTASSGASQPTFPGPSMSTARFCMHHSSTKHCSRGWRCSSSCGSFLRGRDRAWRSPGCSFCGMASSVSL